MELERIIWKVPPNLEKMFRKNFEIRKILSPIVYLEKYSPPAASSSSSPIKKDGKNSNYDNAHFFKDHKSIDDWGEASIKLQEHLAKGVNFIKSRDPVPVQRNYVFPNPESQPILTRVGALPQLISRKAFIAITDDLSEKLIAVKNMKMKAAKSKKSHQSRCAVKRRRSAIGVPDDSECVTPKKSKKKVNPKKIQLDKSVKSSPSKIGATSISPSKFRMKRCSVTLKRLHPNTIANYVNRCSAKNL